MSGRMIEIKLKCGGAALLSCCRFLEPLHKHLLFAVKYVTITLLNKGDGGFMSLPDALQPDLRGLCPTVAAFCGGVFRFARRQRRFGKRAAVPTAYQGKTN